MDSEAVRLLWIGTALGAGIAVVITLIAAADSIPRWSVSALVILGATFFCGSAIGLGLAKLTWTNIRIRDVAIFAAIWLAMILLGWKVWPSVRVEETLKVDFITVLVDTTRNLERADLWVLYPSGYGDTVSPVSLYAFLSITNRYSEEVSITSYSLAIKSDECGWQYLSPIPAKGAQLLWAYGGLGRAESVGMSDSLDALWEKPIAARSTQYGTLMFDSKTSCGIRAGNVVQFRLELVDSTGRTNTYTSSNIGVQKTFTPGSSIGQAHSLQLRMTGYVVDASNAHKRFHCDPIPDDIKKEDLAGRLGRRTISPPT